MKLGLGLDLTSGGEAASGDEPPTLTFSTGLTRVSNTITANLSTGIAGGQTATGGTAAAENLLLSASSHGTKGYVGITYAARATANYGSLSVGSGAFDGSTSGFFVGSANGTQIAINSASGSTSDLFNAQVAGVNQFKISSGGVATYNGLVVGGNAGGNVINGFSSSSDTTGANFTVGSTSTGRGMNGTTVSAYLFGGASGSMYRTGFMGLISTTATVNYNIANVVFANAPVTTAASGTHAVLANVAFRPVGTVTSGGATVTDGATVYIEGAGSGATNNYALIVDSGASRFDGAVTTLTIKPTQAAGYISSDGSTGATGTITAASTVTVKDGIITLIV